MSKQRFLEKLITHYLPGFLVSYAVLGFLSLIFINPEPNTMSTGGIYKLEFYNNFFWSLIFAIFLALISISVALVLLMFKQIKISLKLLLGLNFIFSSFILFLFMFVNLFLQLIVIPAIFPILFLHSKSNSSFCR